MSASLRSLPGEVLGQLRALYSLNQEDLVTTALAFLALMLPPMPSLHVKIKRKHVDPRVSVVAPYNSKLDRMAYCESTDRWWLDTGNGFYGGLQFTLSTWYSVGGRGYPNQNSELEQKYRAVLVFKRRGSWADWPVCGYR